MAQATIGFRPGDTDSLTPAINSIGASPAPPTPSTTALTNPTTALQDLGLPANASASDTYAAITKDQWNQYVSTFVPIENQLISFATNSALPGQAMAQAGTDVGQQFATQAGTLGRQQQALGVTLNPQQQAAQARQLGLNQALSTVQAENTARDVTIAQQQQVLGNPAPSVNNIAQQASLLGS